MAIPMITNLPVRRTGRGGYTTPAKDFQVLNDKTLREHIGALHHGQQELVGLNKLIQRELGLPIDHKRSLIANILYALIPARLRGSLCAEEFDSLELIERLMRTNVDNVQEAMRRLSDCAIATRQELDELGSDLKRAETEGWDARQLQQYMADKADIRIYDVVDQILDSEFKGLSEAEKEKRRIGLLSELRSNIALGEQLMETLGVVCAAGLKVFHQAVGQYHAYTRVYRPIAVIRDAARVLTDTDHSMYAARDALECTVKKSLQVIELAVDAAEMVDNYSIASGDMKGLLEARRKRLNDKLRALEAANDKSVVKQLKPAIAGDPESAIAGGG